MTQANTVYKQRERANKRALGLIRVEAWVLPDSRAEVQQIEARDRTVAEKAHKRLAPSEK